MIFLIIITICSIFIAIICATNKKKVDIITEEKNQQIAIKNRELENTYNFLLSENEGLDKENFKLKEKQELIYQAEKEEQKKLELLQNSIKNTLNSQEELSRKAFENWCNILDKDYLEKENEYNLLIENLKSSYAKQQLSLLEESEKYKKDLDKIKSTRAAIIEAQRKEKEIQEQSSFYCLKISDEDKADIQRLESIKKTLHKPRVLSMLIWSTWFQKQLKTLAANILGSVPITGIYKITNIITGECYIGQARDIASRWAEHAKCGLGIDAPAANKLYKAMQEYGLYSFSWELLEKCSIEELNEKEKFYIELYDSYNMGYNSNKGINK